MDASQNASFELRFRALVPEHRALAFPCDARGLVDLDALSERTRADYFYARTFIGREFAAPTVGAHRVQPARSGSRA